MALSIDCEQIRHILYSCVPAYKEESPIQYSMRCDLIVHAVIRSLETRAAINVSQPPSRASENYSSMYKQATNTTILIEKLSIIQRITINNPHRLREMIERVRDTKNY